VKIIHKLTITLYMHIIHGVKEDFLIKIELKSRERNYV